MQERQDILNKNTLELNYNTKKMKNDLNENPIQPYKEQNDAKFEQLYLNTVQKGHNIDKNYSIQQYQDTLDYTLSPYKKQHVSPIYIQRKQKYIFDKSENKKNNQQFKQINENDLIQNQRRMSIQPINSNEYQKQLILRKANQQLLNFEQYQTVLQQQEIDNKNQDQRQLEKMQQKTYNRNLKIYGNLNLDIKNFQVKQPYQEKIKKFNYGKNQTAKKLIKNSNFQKENYDLNQKDISNTQKILNSLNRNQIIYTKNRKTSNLQNMGQSQNKSDLPKDKQISSFFSDQKKLMQLSQTKQFKKQLSLEDQISPKKTINKKIEPTEPFVQYKKQEKQYLNQLKTLRSKSLASPKKKIDIDIQKQQQQFTEKYIDIFKRNSNNLNILELKKPQNDLKFPHTLHIVQQNNINSKVFEDIFKNSPDLSQFTQSSKEQQQIFKQQRALSHQQYENNENSSSKYKFQLDYEKQHQLTQNRLQKFHNEIYDQQNNSPPKKPRLRLRSIPDKTKTIVQLFFNKKVENNSNEINNFSNVIKQKEFENQSQNDQGDKIQYKKLNKEYQKMILQNLNRGVIIPNQQN